MIPLGETSDTISAVAARLAPHRDDGVYLAAVVVEHLVRELRGAAEEVRQMEVRLAETLMLATTGVAPVSDPAPLASMLHAGFPCLLEVPAPRGNVIPFPRGAR